MSPKEAEDMQIPAPPEIHPSRSVKTALEYLVTLIDEDHGAKHGWTALYWKLYYAVCDSLKRPEGR